MLMIWSVGEIAAKEENVSVYGLGSSPDGRLLAIGLEVRESGLLSERRLGTMDLKDQRVRFLQLPNGIGPSLVDRVSWSPDSTNLAFIFSPAPAGAPPDYSRQLFADLATGKKPDSIPSPEVWLGSVDKGRVRRVLGGKHHSWDYPRIFGNGECLLARDASCSNVALSDISSEMYGFVLPQTFWNLRHVHRFGYDWDAKEQCVYVSVGHGAPKKEIGVWRVDFPSGERRRLSDKIGVNSLFTSPSGQWLGFAEWANSYAQDDPRRNEGWTVCVASLPEFTVRALSACGTERFLAWSVEKDRLAFCEKGQIAVWTPATNKIIRMRVPEGQPQDLSWISSTDVIVYGIDNREIWSLDATSGERRRILSVGDVLTKACNDPSKPSGDKTGKTGDSDQVQGE